MISRFCCFQAFSSLKSWSARALKSLDKILSKLHSIFPLSAAIYSTFLRQMFFSIPIRRNSSYADHISGIRHTSVSYHHLGISCESFLVVCSFNLHSLLCSLVWTDAIKISRKFHVLIRFHWHWLRKMHFNLMGFQLQKLFNLKSIN